MKYNFIDPDKLERAKEKAGAEASEEEILIAYLKLGGLVKNEKGKKIPSYADPNGKEYVDKLEAKEAKKK